MSTKLQKWGGSVGVRIPSYILKMLGWAEGEEVNVLLEYNDKKIVIVKADEKENK